MYCSLLLLFIGGKKVKMSFLGIDSVNMTPEELLVDKKEMERVGWSCSLCGHLLIRQKGGEKYNCNKCKLKFKVVKH